MTVSLSDPLNATQLLCGCGCGTELTITRSYRIPTYVSGHASRVLHPVPEPVWEGDCLRWQGSHTTGGYGTWYDPRSQKKNTVHRIFWEKFHGPITDGLTIDHVYAWGCRFKDCFRISHMELVTPGENTRRKNLGDTCKWGHPRTEENILLVYYPTHGMRQCRPCTTRRMKKMRDKRISEEKVNRDPCAQCGQPIPDARSLAAKFCTNDCKIIFHSRARFGKQEV